MRSAVGLAVLSAAAVISGCGSSAIGPQSHPSAAARATPSVAGPRNAHELTVRAVRASRVRVRAGVDGLVAAYGAMWVSGSGAVTRLDASTGRVVAGIRTPGVNELGYIAAGRGSVWATATGNGDVYRIDPSTNQVAATIHVGGPVVGIAVGAGQVWVSRPASRARGRGRCGLRRRGCQSRSRSPKSIEPTRRRPSNWSRRRSHLSPSRP